MDTPTAPPGEPPTKSIREVSLAWCKNSVTRNMHRLVNSHDSHQCYTLQLFMMSTQGLEYLPKVVSASASKPALGTCLENQASSNLLTFLNVMLSPYCDLLCFYNWLLADMGGKQVTIAEASKKRSRMVFTKEPSKLILLSSALLPSHPWIRVGKS